MLFENMKHNLLSQTYENKWCDPGKYGEHHTMCKYPEGAQHSCGKVLRRGVKHQVINGDSQWQPFIQEIKQLYIDDMYTDLSS